MAIYHGSVRRPAALQRAEFPIARTTPAPNVPVVVPARTDAAAPVRALPVQPVSPSRPRSSDGTKKRPRAARSQRAVADAGGESAPDGDASGAAVAAPNSGPEALAAKPVSVSVEHLLQLPRGELAELLAHSGESAQKVWLALIYRLSALESQVTELAAALRAAGSASTKRPAASVHVVGGDGKAGVLEQVFRKNLSLRKGGGD